MELSQDEKMSIISLYTKRLHEEVLGIFKLPIAENDCEDISMNVILNVICNYFANSYGTKDDRHSGMSEGVFNSFLDSVKEAYPGIRKNVSESLKARQSQEATNDSH